MTKTSFFAKMGNNFNRNVRLSTFPTTLGAIFFIYGFQIKSIGAILLSLSTVSFIIGLVLAIKELKNAKTLRIPIISLIVLAAYIAFAILCYRANMLAGISF